MKDKHVTVSDVSALIAEREETRAELHLLTLEAYEHWRALESKLHALEARFNLSCGEISEVRIRIPTAEAPVESPPTERFIKSQ